MKQFFILLSIAFFAVSCKSSKNNTEPTKDQDQELLINKPSNEVKSEVKVPSKDINKIAVSELAAQHYALFEDFKTLNIKSDVDFSDGKIDQSIAADIKMERNKQILISAKLLMFFEAKIYLTPERASFYETLTGTHYDGDFKFLSKFLGTNITYENVENMLLGKAFYNLNTNNYTKIKSNELELKLNQFLMRLVLGTKHQVASTEITQNQSTDKLVVQYPSYQLSENMYLPKEIKIQAKQKDIIEIGIDYKKIFVNKSIDFKYIIPSGSKPIKI